MNDDTFDYSPVGGAFAFNRARRYSIEENNNIE
jgi:hypothetical protein